MADYITSRSFALPGDAGSMEGSPWFNMWGRQLWPYTTIEVGDTLYWYDAREESIVWKSIISKIGRGPYESHEQAIGIIEKIFGHLEPSNPYLVRAPENGYVVAYRIADVEEVHLQKPAGLRIPQLGWMRDRNPGFSDWLGNEPIRVTVEGQVSDDITKLADKVASDGYFAPSSLDDNRERKLREIVQRRGQPEFRKTLMTAYGGKCAVTGCDAIAALEAAHLVPYMGPQANDVRNGLLLRADIHTLFDLDLIGIEPETLIISLAPDIKSSSYCTISGAKLAEPAEPSFRPSKQALADRWKRFKGT
jgi:hypothetical protein